MAGRDSVDPHELRAAVAEVLPWLAGSADRPERSVLARAVRLSLRVLPAVAPGRSVEVRVPPFAAVQCVAGPRHTRGTPPNVIETDPRSWLLLATGRLSWADAVDRALVSASGSRADLTALLPVVRL
jgi:Bacterial SCP ortholog